MELDIIAQEVHLPVVFAALATDAQQVPQLHLRLVQNVLLVDIVIQQQLIHYVHRAHME